MDGQIEVGDTVIHREFNCKGLVLSLYDLLEGYSSNLKVGRIHMSNVPHSDLTLVSKAKK